jgi:hypothetical protein
VPEAEIVDCSKFFRRKHNLKAFGAKIVHRKAPRISRMSNLLNRPNFGGFHNLRKKHQMSRIT